MCLHWKRWKTKNTVCTVFLSLTYANIKMCSDTNQSKGLHYLCKIACNVSVQKCMCVCVQLWLVLELSHFLPASLLFPLICTQDEWNLKMKHFQLPQMHLWSLCCFKRIFASIHTTCILLCMKMPLNSVPFDSAVWVSKINRAFFCPGGLVLVYSY